MYLLNVETRNLECFKDHRQVTGKYAILSHTWEAEEVTFEKLQSPEPQMKESFKKVEYICQQAAKDDLRYVWVDTCCIDKKSSAELLEAINSMWQYYYDAKICYVYLSDLKVDDSYSGGLSEIEGSLRGCRWFKRGWTLQELIAPLKVWFFDQQWTHVGKKTNVLGSNDNDVLASITGINSKVLGNRDQARQQSIAARFSWAANRSTTRLEDEAYCLLGLCGVNMPLLYGEGSKAFLRLQEEFIRTSSWTDHSILCHGNNRTLLASNASDFFGKGNIRSWPTPQLGTFQLWNTELILMAQSQPWGRSGIIVVLDCCKEEDHDSRAVLSLSKRPLVEPRGFSVPRTVTTGRQVYDKIYGNVSYVPTKLKTLFEEREIVIAREHFPWPDIDKEILILPMGVYLATLRDSRWLQWTSEDTFLDFSYLDKGSTTVKRSEKLCLSLSLAGHFIYSLEIVSSLHDCGLKGVPWYVGKCHSYSANLRCLEERDNEERDNEERDNEERDARLSLSSSLVLEEGKWVILQGGDLKLHVKLHLGSNAGSMMWCLSISGSPLDEEDLHARDRVSYDLQDWPNSLLKSGEYHRSVHLV